MVDTDTGEILATKYSNYALNFATKNDAGFTMIMRWVQSCVRGIRNAGHNGIELKIYFCEEKECLSLPFGMTVDDANKLASEYVY